MDTSGNSNVTEFVKLMLRKIFFDAIRPVVYREFYNKHYVSRPTVVSNGIDSVIYVRGKYIIF
jgi:hypothetical protein